LLLKTQQKASKQIRKRLKKFGVACLWGESRSGKTRTFLDASRGYKTLVITLKSAISGIKKEAKAIGVNCDVINYESVTKVTKTDYELVICDESHKFISQSTPKPSITWKNVKKHTTDKLLILSSATPTSEGFGGLYYQLALSNYTPFKYKRFTLFFEEYGIPSTIYTGLRRLPSYKKTKIDKIENDMKHLVVRLRRVHEFESQDITHQIPFTSQQEKIAKILNDELLYIKDGYEILADTSVKKMTKLHQLAGGIGIKCEDDSIMYLKKSNKIKYIQDNFDVDNTIILSYYVHEQDYLKDIFSHTGSVTKLSTGVDLSHYKDMIVYSMGFSSANYFQVKARLMNIKRTTQMQIHYLLSGIDNDVLRAVQSKENFTTRWFRK